MKIAQIGDYSIHIDYFIKGINNVQVECCIMTGTQQSSSYSVYQTMCNEEGNFPLKFMLSQLLTDLRETDINGFPFDALTHLAREGMKND